MNTRSETSAKPVVTTPTSPKGFCFSNDSDLAQKRRGVASTLLQRSRSAIKCHLLPVSALAAFLAGCATSSQVNWDNRVGHYTYMEAVQELGQPNREVQLANGATEFRWFLQQPTTGNSFAAGGMDNNPGVNGANNSMAMSHGVSPVLNNRYLQLTFDSNGVLTAWSKNY